MAFEERFQLLVASGQAIDLSVAATRRALARVEAQYSIPLTGQSGGLPLAITVGVLGFNLLGDGLGDMLDPHLVT